MDPDSTKQCLTMVYVPHISNTTTYIGDYMSAIFELYISYLFCTGIRYWLKGISFLLSTVAQNNYRYSAYLVAVKHGQNV